MTSRIGNWQEQGAMVALLAVWFSAIDCHAIVAQETVVEAVMDLIQQSLPDAPYEESFDAWEATGPGGFGENPATWSPPRQQLYGADPATWGPNGDGVFIDPNALNPNIGGGTVIPNRRIMPNNGAVQPNRDTRSPSGQPAMPVDGTNPKSAVLQFPGYGLQLQIQSGKNPLVVQVDKGSAAHQARLRKGDQLISLNGRSASTAYAELNRPQDAAFNIRFLRKSLLKSAQLVHKSEPDFGYFPVSRTGLLATDGGLKVVYTDGSKGLKRGDLIRSADRVPVQSIAQFVERVTRLQGNFAVYFSRPGRKELFSISLPVDEFQAFEGCASIELEVLGVTLENYFDFHRVVSVVPDSLASTMGLESGDKIIGVNGKQVSRIEDVIQEYEDMKTIAAARGSSVMQFSPTTTAAGRVKATLELANFSERPVQLFWKQPNGDEPVEKLFGIVPPNRSIQQPTFVDHQWSVRDPQSGDILLEIVVESTNSQFVVPPTDNVLVLSDSGATVKSIANRRLLITSMDEGSPVTRFGLLVGDQLIRINNKDASAFVESGESLDEDSTLTVLLQGQAAPIQIKADRSTVQEPADYELPEWVTESSEENLPGGITVTQPQDGETPSIANLAAYHISEESGESQKLQRVVYYGTQVVAGRNHFLVCEMVNQQSGENSVWNIEIYVNPNKKTEIRAIDRLR